MIGLLATLPRRSRTLVAGVATVFAIALVGGYLVSHHLSASANRPGPADNGVLGFPMLPIGKNPWPDGESLGLSEAETRFEQQTGSSMTLPTDPLASVDRISIVWYHATKVDDGSVDVSVRLDYVDDGFTVRYAPMSRFFGNDPGAAYKRMYESLGSQSNILDTLDGVTTFIEPRDSSPSGNPGSLDMVVQGVEVVIIGDLTNEQLRRIAGSIITNT
jgi:hypothetical protein